jgi:hypothetical protein
MPYAYVYSPFTAEVRGLATYCIDGSTHNSGFANYGMCCPVDIGGSQYISTGSTVLFYCNSAIASIRTIRRNDFCVGSFGSPYEDAVFVQMYRSPNAVGLIGTMFYGHLADRIVDGVWNTPNGRVLGRLSGIHPTCCCYTYPHIHVGRGTNGTTISLSCYQLLNRGVDWFYRWYYA